MRLRHFLMSAFMTAVFGVSPAAASGKVPHYFPDGVGKETNPARQISDYFNDINAMDTCRGTRGADAAMPRFFAHSIKVPKTFEGREVTFIFDPWERSPRDGKIYYNDFCGRHEITEEQMQTVIDDMVRHFAIALDNTFEFHREIEDVAVKGNAAQEGKTVEEYRKKLADPVPDAPGITFRELQQLPLPMTKAQFVPKEVHLGFNPYLGVCWLNSGVLWVTPQARVLDEIHGAPKTLAHEMVHADTNLQSLPLSGGVDVEFLASVPMMLGDDNHIALPYHGYLKELRKMARVLFGYDFDQVKREVILYDHAGNIRIDETKYNEYFGKLKAVKEELRTFFRDVALPAYYRNQVFWTGLHNRLNDDLAVFRIMLATRYCITILGSCEETSQFLNAHRDDTLQLAKAAYDEMGKSSEDKGGGEYGDYVVGNRRLSPMTIAEIERAFGVSKEHMLKLAKKHGIKPEDLVSKPPVQVIAIFMNIIEKEQAELERRTQ